MRLDTVKPVFEHDGPFVTVYTEVGRDSEDAMSQLEARWTTISHELESAELSSDLIAEIGRRVQENTHLPGDVRRTVLATSDEIVFDDVQPGHTHWPEVADVAPLPQLAGWIAAGDAARSFLLVVADRVGADLSIHRAVPGPADEEASVEGEDFYITKVAEGDWAQKQYQRTAENNWVHNARLVADEARSLARRHGTRATLVAGETRARAEVLRALREEDEATVAPLIEIESGGRAAGSSETALWNEIREAMTHLEGEDDAEVGAQLDEALGRGEGAATGLNDVADALAQSRVDRLVLDLAELEGRTIATDRLDGVPLPAAARAETELPADRALVAAAALTGASVTLLSSAMSHGGVAALLRWA